MAHFRFSLEFARKIGPAIRRSSLFLGLFLGVSATAQEPPQPLDPSLWRGAFAQAEKDSEASKVVAILKARLDPEGKQSAFDALLPIFSICPKGSFEGATEKKINFYPTVIGEAPFQQVKFDASLNCAACLPPFETERERFRVLVHEMVHLLPDAAQSQYPSDLKDLESFVSFAKKEWASFGGELQANLLAHSRTVALYGQRSGTIEPESAHFAAGGVLVLPLQFQRQLLLKAGYLEQLYAQYRSRLQNELALTELAIGTLYEAQAPEESPELAKWQERQLALATLLIKAGDLPPKFTVELADQIADQSLPGGIQKFSLHRSEPTNPQ